MRLVLFFLFSMITLGVLLLLSMPALADQLPFPKKAFVFSEEVYKANAYECTVDSNSREKVLASLMAPNRDDLLDILVSAGKVCAQNVYGEDESTKKAWYDLRGITVRQGELSGKANLSKICWDYAGFKGVDLSGAELNSALMRGVVFDDINFQNANLDNADLSYCIFVKCNLQNTNFRLAHLGRAKFIECNLDNARFDNCGELNDVVFDHGSARQAVFDGSSMVATRFVGIDLTRSKFVAADLTDVVFHESLVNGVDFTEANLFGAKLNGANGAHQLRLVNTKLGGTYLGDVDITSIDVLYINWYKGDFRIGEEIEADNPPPHNAGERDRRRLYIQAEVIYRALSERYRQIGHKNEYLKFRYRANETRRKLLAMTVGKRGTLEFLWLTLSRAVDGYGTNFKKLIVSFCWTIAVFTLIFWSGWVFFAKKWACWYHTVPGSATLRANKDETFMHSSPPPQEFCRRRREHNRFVGAILIVPAAIYLSLDSFFLFANKVIDIDVSIHLLHRKEERIVPVNFGRVIAGIEAAAGLFLLYSTLRMILVMTGWSSF